MRSDEQYDLAPYVTCLPPLQRVSTHPSFSFEFTAWQAGHAYVYNIQQVLDAGGVSRPGVMEPKYWSNPGKGDAGEIDSFKQIVKLTIALQRLSSGEPWPADEPEPTPTSVRKAMCCVVLQRSRESM